MNADLPVLLPLVKAGKVKALALFSPERTPLLPDLPTTKEARLSRHDHGELVRLLLARRHTERRARQARKGGCSP